MNEQVIESTVRLLGSRLQDRFLRGKLRSFMPVSGHLALIQDKILRYYQDSCESEPACDEDELVELALDALEAIVVHVSADEGPTIAPAPAKPRAGKSKRPARRGKQTEVTDEEIRKAVTGEDDNAS